MSYNVWAHYVAETTRENRLEALHKASRGLPMVGTESRNRDVAQRG